MPYYFRLNIFSIIKKRMATTGEQAYRERYKRTNEQARGDIRVEGAGGAGSYISGGAKGRGTEDRRNDAL